jgi:acetyl-CoA carboxylase biotin carboxyl carrier protein
VGDVVTRGQTVALLEVMKTFNRLTYGGDHLPERARVVAVHPRDEDDLDEDDAIFDLEPA